MALFGSSRKRQLEDTLYGLPTDMAPIGRPGDPRGDYAPIERDAYDPQGGVGSGGAPKPKFFGEGGVGRAIAGNVGDFLLQLNHMAPIYQPAMEHQRNIQELDAQRQRDREAEYQQAIRLKQWELANRPPDLPEPVKLANYYRSMGRDDLADAVEAKSAAMSGVNSSGQPVVMNPAPLFQQPVQGGVKPLTDDDIAGMDAGGASHSGSRTFRRPGLFGRR